MKLEKELDAIQIGAWKLYVNLPRYAKGRDIRQSTGNKSKVGDDTRQSFGNSGGKTRRDGY